MTAYFVVLLAFLSQTGFSGSRVAVSLHALDLTANQFAIGLVIALYSLAPMFLSIAIGRVADRTPARRMVLAASIVMSAAMLLPWLASGIAVLCIASFFLGFAHQVFSLPIEAAIGGIGGPEKRARNYALITMAWSAANFLGPIIAGFSIDHLGQREVYVVLASFIFAPVVVLTAMKSLLASTGEKHSGGGARGSVLELWRIRPLRTTLIAAGIVGTAQDLFQFYMPIYGSSVGLSASAIGTILGMCALAAFVIRAILPFLSRKATEAQILLGAIATSAFTFLLFPLFTHAVPLAVIAFLLGLGVGCAMPMTMSLLYVLAPSNRLAEAFGMHKTIRNTTHLVVPLFFGSIGAAFGYAAVFLSNFAMLATSGMLLKRSGMPQKAGDKVTK